MGVLRSVLPSVAVLLLSSSALAQTAPATNPPATEPTADRAPATTAAPATPAAEAPAGDAATTAATQPVNAPAAESTASTEAPAASASVELHGTLETYYGYNFNEPSNGVTNGRYYDVRHNMLGLQNALLETRWSAARGAVTGTVQLQLGAFHELFWPGERSVEEDLLWRLIQEATTEWHTPWEPLSIDGGVYNVPFGPEYNVVYKNWHWSTSNLFAIMPYQIAGFRANLDLGHGWVARLGVYNGWDRIVTDNNSSKSVMAAVEWTDADDEETYFVAEYMVGNERDREDPRGPYARHTFDVYGQWHFAQPFTVRGHIFAALEPGRDANDGWFGAALSAKWDALSWFSLAARGDVLRSFAGAQNILHGDYLDDPTRSTLLGSVTLTGDFHPTSFMSLRLEARHDRADFPYFYSGSVERLPAAMGGGFVPTQSNQTTLLAGLTTWF